jgi:Flp pilus assembly protein TadG
MHGAEADRRVRHPGERGAVLVVVAVLLVALIGFGSLVFDMGQLYTVRGELQNTTDSASLAGALMLDRTEDGLERARQEVRDYAQRHRSDFRASEIADEDIIFGVWDPVTEIFTDLGVAPNPALVNAVRVRDRRAEQDGNPVILRLAPTIGHTRGNVATQAVAISGGPAVECGFPMTVPDCSLESALEDGSCDHCFVYQEGPNVSQNAGWTDFGEGNVGQGTIANLIGMACADVDPDTHECIGECVSAAAGDSVKGQHGNFLNQGTGPCPLIQDLLMRDGTPRPIVVRVPVFESTATVCSDQNFSGHLNITGFAALEIYGASCGSNDDDAVLVPDIDSCPPPPSGKYITARLRCDMESEGPPGGGFFGLDTRRSRLVQ